MPEQPRKGIAGLNADQLRDLVVELDDMLDTALKLTERLLAVHMKIRPARGSQRLMDEAREDAFRIAAHVTYVRNMVEAFPRWRHVWK